MDHMVTATTTTTRMFGGRRTSSSSSSSFSSPSSSYFSSTYLSDHSNRRRHRCTLSGSSSTNVGISPAFMMFQKIQDDYLALTRRVTARHILLPSKEPADALKQKIRMECIGSSTSSTTTSTPPPSQQQQQQSSTAVTTTTTTARKRNNNGRFIMDVFEDAAIKYSRDDTTNFRGGLIGELVPQGYCRSSELDRLCFEIPIGQLYGPIQTNYGWHLLLVSERTNCPKIDGDKTKLIQTTSDDTFGTLVSSTQVGTVNIPDIILQQVGFWFVCIIAGGVVAELAERLVSSL